MMKILPLFAFCAFIASHVHAEMPDEEGSFVRRAIAKVNSWLSFPDKHVGGGAEALKKAEDVNFFPKKKKSSDVNLNELYFAGMKTDPSSSKTDDDENGKKIKEGLARANKLGDLKSGAQVLTDTYNADPRNEQKITDESQIARIGEEHITDPHKALKKLQEEAAHG